MSHGRLRCIGENLHLKNIYGNGFKIELRVEAGAAERAAMFISDISTSLERINTVRVAMNVVCVCV
jgi:hypothetical protein